MDVVQAGIWQQMGTAATMVGWEPKLPYVTMHAPKACVVVLCGCDTAGD